jgi:SpoVK/Ycf46/Vps4 family AAA+-type ATPase
MDNTDDLRLLLASRYPLIVAEMQDEERFMDILRRAASEVGAPVWTWSVTTGLRREGFDPQYGTTDPVRALDFIAQLDGPGVFVLADIHPHLENPAVVRRVKEIAQAARPGQTVVLTAPRRVLPPELSGLALPWTLKPPAREEIEGLVRRTLDDLAARNFPVSLDRAGIDSLVEALRGLSRMEAERLIRQAAMRDGAIAPADVEFVRAAKADLLQAGGVLELVQGEARSLDQVGGMEHLKEWLRLRGRALEPRAAAFGLDPPRGVLLTGVPGCGKSLIAKSLARTWNLPLVLLDPARLYGPYVGESEQRLADALRTVEAMAPVVVWIDEIEKGFASGGTGDGGVSRRLVGTFLRWMQDRPAGIFLVATCNDVESLPPELLRKGRFDEVFFVDLPEVAEREEIFRVHLGRRGHDPAGFDLAALAAASEGFSGAEIEAAAVGALYRAYAASGELTTDELLAELAGTVPLSRSREEDVSRLRTWASGRALAA